MGGAASARSFPPRRRGQFVARPALAADRHHRLPENVGKPLGWRHRARGRPQTGGRGPAAGAKSGRFGALDELLDDLAMRFTERAQQLGVAVQSAEPSADAIPVVVAVDVQLIERAGANLVDNALKFSAPVSTLTLNAQWLEGSPSTACITVSEQGTGIAHDDLPHPFDRFYQSRHRRRRQRFGTGHRQARCRAARWRLVGGEHAGPRYGGHADAVRCGVSASEAACCAR